MTKPIPGAKLGRPPSDDAVRERVQVRLSTEQRAKAKRAAKRARKNLGEWIRSLIVAAS